MQINTKDPDVEAQFRKDQDSHVRDDISHQRDATAIKTTYLEVDSTLNDYYTTTGKYEVLELDRVEYSQMLGNLSIEDQALLTSGKNFYEITFKNHGGLVMPLIIEFQFEDGTSDLHRIPAEIWRMSEPTVTKVFETSQPATQIVLDPFEETADCDMSNNYWPPKPQPTRFQLYKEGDNSFKEYRNPMQRDQDNQEYLDSLEGE